MSQATPSLNFGEYLPRSVGGYRKAVAISHPLTGDIFLSAETAEWHEVNNILSTEYALTPPTGAKQKTLHGRGTSEIDWSLSGDLTNESSGLLNLLKPEARGVGLRRLEISQGSEGGLFTTTNDYSIPWSSISFTGSPNGNVTFSLQGKSTLYPTATSGLVNNNAHHPIPSWATGNEKVKTWNISHSVGLTAAWANNPQPQPTYYRPSSSAWKIDFTLVRQILDHTLVRFQAGGFALVECMVTSRNYKSGSRNKAFEYSISVENVHQGKDAYTNTAATLDIPIWPQSCWPEGST